MNEDTSATFKAGLTFRQEADNLSHLVLETNLQNTISFVDNQRSQIVEDETFGVLRQRQYAQR